MTIYNAVLPVYLKHLPHCLSADPQKKKKKKTGNQSFLFPAITRFCVLFLKGNAIIHHKTDEYTKDLFNLKTKQGTRTSKNKYF